MMGETNQVGCWGHMVCVVVQWHLLPLDYLSVSDKCLGIVVW